MERPGQLFPDIRPNDNEREEPVHQNMMMSKISMDDDTLARLAEYPAL